MQASSPLVVDFYEAKGGWATHHGSAGLVTTFSDLLPPYPYPAISQFFFQALQNSLVLALICKANKWFSTYNPFISPACPYVCRLMGIISSS